MIESNTILSVKKINISFADFTAVKSLDFSLKKNKTLAIVGESGSGKSLTALALIGLLPKNAVLNGEIIFHKNNQAFLINELSEKEIKHVRGKEISMIFQEPMSALNPVMKIGKQLSESILAHQKISKKQAKIIAINWLQNVQLPEPENIYERFPHQLSGGQKQRVMIAMAMMHHPAVLIADEPTTALDVTVQKEIVLLMKQLQIEFETAMIFITHDLALAASIADELLVLYRGEAVEYGNAEKLIHAPQHPYTKALLACRPSAEHKGVQLQTVSDFLNPSTQTEITKSTLSEQQHFSESCLLKVENLKIFFSAKRNLLGNTTSVYKAVNDISFELKRGETLGLVGESGCGKSTLSRGLMGLIPFTANQIWLDGKDMTALDSKGWYETRKKIQMIFQDPYSSLNPRLTIEQIISEPLLVHKVVPKSEIKSETVRLLNLVQLPADALKKYPHEFSGGQRQRIGIARALALRPELLICDESVSALDVSIQAQMLNLLRDLQNEYKLTYLFISHDLNVVYYFCDRIIVMKSGEFVEENEAKALFAAPQNEYTKKLIAAIPENIS